MENTNHDEFNPDEDWFDGLFSDPAAGDEIGTDEHAASSAGLTDIKDLELEKIIQEALAAEWDPAAEPEEPLPLPAEDVQYSDEAYAEAPAEAPVEPPLPPDEPVEDEDPNAPVRKVRPKRRAGYGLLGIPHLLSTAIWLVLAVAIGVSAGRLMWVCASDILAFGREDRVITLTITSRDNIDTITDKLYNSGLIKYPELFRMYAKLAHADQKISVGTFTLNTLYDYHALVNGLSDTSSYRETVSVVIPEGYSCAQIFALLEEKGVCAAADLEAYASQSPFADYEFLEGVERGSKYCLEGYLFPDTYEFYSNDTPKRVFMKLLARFDNQLIDGLDEKLAALNEKLSAKMRKNGCSEDYINEHQMTLYEVVIVASMIEKESANSLESATVSSVIYNRLTNPKNYPKLQIDATIVYAQGGASEGIDLELDSPYNTYKYDGLTPGAISNPGLTSILAALNPEDTAYYYYVLDPSAGQHIFSKTLAEHEAAKDKVSKQ